MFMALVAMYGLSRIIFWLGIVFNFIFFAFQTQYMGKCLSNLQKNICISSGQVNKCQVDIIILLPNSL